MVSDNNVTIEKMEKKNRLRFIVVYITHDNLLYFVNLIYFVYSNIYYLQSCAKYIWNLLRFTENLDLK